jgi:hypothetical protein
MGGEKPKPFPAMIISGIGIIYFVIVARMMGIFTWRSGWESHALTEADEPELFYFAVVVTLAVAAAFMIWGLLRSKR